MQWSVGPGTGCLPAHSGGTYLSSSSGFYVISLFTLSLSSPVFSILPSYFIKIHTALVSISNSFGKNCVCREQECSVCLCGSSCTPPSRPHAGPSGMMGFTSAFHPLTAPGQHVGTARQSPEQGAVQPSGEHRGPEVTQGPSPAGDVILVPKPSVRTPVSWPLVH